MDDQILAVAAVLAAFVVAIGGASYVFAITTERNPRDPRPDAERSTGPTTRSR